MPSINAAEVFAQVEASVADRSQVFTGVLEELESILTSKMPAAFALQIYIRAGLYALQLVMILGSLALRFAAGDKWLFRIVRCRFGTYVAPNFGCVWQVWICFFLVEVQINGWLLVRIEQRVPAGYYFSSVIVWLAFWFAALSAVWALAVSQCELASRTTAERRVWQRPAFIHAVFIGYPVVELVSICVVGGLTDRNFAPQIDAIDSVAASLAAAAQSASGLSATQLDSAIKVEIAQLQRAFDRMSDFYKLFRISGCINLAHDAFSWGVYLVTAVPYLLSLRDQLKQPTQRAGAQVGFDTYKELRWSLYTATATCAGLSLACLAFAVVQAYQIVLATSHPNTTAILVDTLAIQWIFAGLGLPLCAGALARSYQLLRRPTVISSTWFSSQQLEAAPPDRSASASVSAARRSKAARTLGGSRDEGRFMVTIDQVTEVDDETSDPLTLGRMDKNELPAARWD